MLTGLKFGAVKQLPVFLNAPNVFVYANDTFQVSGTRDLRLLAQGNKGLAAYGRAEVPVMDTSYLQPFTQLVNKATPLNRL
jgi:hypothetical protein